MISTFAYLCVDADGSEHISGNMPKRIEEDIDGVPYHYWFDETMIELPIGTIQSIILDELTWSDDPYPLEG